MSDKRSLADDTVYTLGEIQRMLDGVDNEGPMRHMLREMKRHAEKSVSDGITLAQDICNTARQLKRDMKVKS